MRSLVPFVVPACTLVLAAPGQTTAHRPHPATPGTTSSAATPSDLHVTRVSLYKNGIGFFEHTGQVTGNQSVRLDLTSAQLNDVLQTLTAVDLGGGHITGANYNSTTPLDQQLQNVPFSLGEQPSQQDLYNALRGARVEVTGSGPVFSGRILSLEIRNAAPADDSKEHVAPERRMLTVISDAGATRTLELTSTTSVRLLDAGLRTDLNSYLALLDRNRMEGVRHLTLTDRGTGTRALHVSFLSEVPVWKSTYRLLLTTHAGATAPSTQTATVQGFSVVDNTTGEDWNDVQLSLIAGNPQSFLQPLAQPIYDRRPEVPIAENAQMTPQTHDSAIDGLPAPPNSASASPSSAGGNPMALRGSPSGTGSASGSGFVADRVANMARDTAPPPPPSAPMLAYEALAQQTVVPNATAKSFDDFFAYNLTDPVTIPRNGSALVPILQTQLPSEQVTLWSPTEPSPLRALWLTNSSQLTLDRGSFSVVEDGAFAGEGLLDPVHPGERRLLSYAADQAVRVTPNDRHDAHHVTSLSISQGVLRVNNSEVSEVNYTVSNAAPEARVVVMEEPRQTGWTLESDTKPDETTPTAYRFRVPVAPHGSAHLEIKQGHVLDAYFQLVNSSEEQITVYLRENNADPALVAQLQPVFAAKRAVADLDTRINDTQTKIRQITDDQKRVRDNLAALKGSAEERSLARRYTGELNAQEDTLAGLQRDLVSLQQQRSAAQAELTRRIGALQIAAS